MTVTNDFFIISLIINYITSIKSNYLYNLPRFRDRKKIAYHTNSIIHRIKQQEATEYFFKGLLVSEGLIREDKIHCHKSYYMQGA